MERLQDKLLRLKGKRLRYERLGQQLREQMLHFEVMIRKMDTGVLEERIAVVEGEEEANIRKIL